MKNKIKTNKEVGVNEVEVISITKNLNLKLMLKKT